MTQSLDHWSISERRGTRVETMIHNRRISLITDESHWTTVVDLETDRELGSFGSGPLGTMALRAAPLASMADFRTQALATEWIVRPWR